MGKGRGGFRFHVSTILVAVVGIAATLVGFAGATSSVRGSDNALLRQDAAQGAFVLSSYLTQTQSSVTRLVGQVGNGSVDPVAFAEAASTALKQSSLGSIALLDQTGNHLSVVASVGTLHRSFGGSADSKILGLLDRSGVQYPPIVKAGGQNWLGQLFGPKTLALPVGYALYTELEVPPIIPLSTLTGSAFSGVEGAIYLGSERPANLLFATTRHLPLMGERAVARIDTSLNLSQAKLSDKVGSVSYPGSLVLVMDATEHLSGSSSAILPWLILGLGLGATIILDMVLAVALRRRDEALVLVEDLEAKNSELDRSLTREAEAQRNLRRAQRMEAVGKLAGGIAHDFNNLLHVILSYASFMSDTLEPDNPLRDDLAEVQRAGRRAAELTRQLLIFSRRDVVRLEVVELNDVITDAERLIRHTLGEDVVLTCLPSDRPCPVLADRGELDQVLMNLAINSRDAMPLGGSLAISVQHVELGLEQSSAVRLEPGEHVRVEVIDTGTGMTSEVAARAFEPFFTTKETGRGTGLGLAMVYGIVERWKGHVSISSVPGEGTTVTLLFPLYRGELEPSSTKEEEQPQKWSLSSKGAVETVLLVEDEPGVRRSAARILEGGGYRVLEASDASEAVQMSENATIDLVVTDVIMPGGSSGKDLADELSWRRPDLPVVFISGYGSEAIAERGVLSSSTSLLEKPFTAQQLLDVVHRSIAGSDRPSR